MRAATPSESTSTAQVKELYQIQELQHKIKGLEAALRTSQDALLGAKQARDEEKKEVRRLRTLLEGQRRLLESSSASAAKPFHGSPPLDRSRRVSDPEVLEAMKASEFEAQATSNALAETIHTTFSDLNAERKLREVLEEKHKQLANQYNESRSRIESLERELHRTREENSIKTGSLDAAKAEQQRFVEENDELKKKLVEADEELQAMKHRFQQLEEFVESKMSTDGEELASLRRELEGRAKGDEAMEVEVEALKKQLAAKEERLKNMQQEIEESQRHQEELYRSLEEEKQHVASSSEKMKTKSKELLHVQNRCADLEQQVSDQQRRAAEADKRVEGLEAKLQVAQEEAGRVVTQVSSQREAVESWELRTTAAESRVQQLCTEVERLEERLRAENEQLQTWKDRAKVRDLSFKNVMNSG